jgi:hypothetical protein
LTENKGYILLWVCPLDTLRTRLRCRAASRLTTFLWWGIGGMRFTASRGSTTVSLPLASIPGLVSFPAACYGGGVHVGSIRLPKR